MAWRRAQHTLAVFSGTGAVLFCGGALYFRRKTAAPRWQHQYRLEGKKIVVTGGTSGIGKACVRQLKRHGAHVIVGGRDVERRDRLAAELASDGTHGKVDVLPLDLADASSVAAFAARVESLCAGSLHGLINNAAVIECEQQMTAAGIDRTFATNVLGPFQLTNSLLPLLLKTGGAGEDGQHARIVNVGSRLDSRGWVEPSTLLNTGLMFEEPTGSPKATPMIVYASSKLCTSLLTAETYRRLRGQHVDCVCVSPGMVDTSLWRNYPLWYRVITWPFRRFYLRTPDEAASGVVFALAAPFQAEWGGQLVSDGNVIGRSRKTQEEQLGKDLWAACEKLVAANVALSISLSLSTPATNGRARPYEDAK